jgi:hypothetical protein
MDKPVELVWNKGIAALCDRRVPDEFPNGVSYSPVPRLAGEFWSPKLPDDLIVDPSVFAAIRPGELVWVRLSWLKAFAKYVLPEVKSKFVLVTGDSDSSVPSELGRTAREILACPNVVYWFTQNYDGSMPAERISAIPIGIDFHMLSERLIWGESISSPVEQEHRLRSVRDSLPRLENRIPDVYMDFGWQASFGLFHYRRIHPLKGARLREPRPAVTAKLRRNPLVYSQLGPLSRTEMWQTRGRHAFVVSPHGMGLDCHRTWEALALGHIVLTPSSSLDALYAGLPVQTLRSWREINTSNLAKWLALHSRQHAPAEKLTSAYWIRQIRTKAGLPPEVDAGEIAQSIP